LIDPHRGTVASLRHLIFFLSHKPFLRTIARGF
jgi:hypothetical protein